MRKRYILLLLLSLIISCKLKNAADSLQTTSSKHIYSSEKGASVEITLDKAEYYSYENIRLEIKTTYPRNLTPQFPDWTQLDDSMTFLSIDNIEGPSRQGDKMFRIVQIILESRLPGLYLLDPIRIDFFKNDSREDSIGTDNIPVNIISSLLEDNPDIVENTNVLLMDKKRNYIFIASIILAIGILTVFFFLYRHKKKGKVTDSVVNYSEIIDQLDHKNIKAFYSYLTNLLKDFLEDKIFISIRTQTSDEFIQKNRTLPVMEDWLKEQLFSFLIRADRIKFSDFSPKERVLTAIGNFVKILFPIWRIHCLKRFNYEFCKSLGLFILLGHPSNYFL